MKWHIIWGSIAQPHSKLNMIFEAIRKLILPFDAIEPFVPHRGKILDIGCGHGVFSELLAQKAPGRQVVGIDPSRQKIQLAARDHKSTSNIQYKAIGVENLREKNWDAATILDVIYLLPYQEKIRFLKVVRRHLKSKGTLILKEVENEPKWKYYLVLLEEFIMVKVFKLTYSQYGGIYLLSRDQYKQILKDSGFTITTVQSINGLLPYPHVLFVATKN